MKNIILIFFSFLFTLNGFSQNYSMDKIISPKEYLSFSIDLFDNRTYIFSCTKHQINSDVLALQLLSFGQFKEIDDTYILRDTFNEYELRLHKIKNKTGKNTFLKSIDGFEWMKNNIFILSNIKPNDTRFLIQNISFPTKNKKIDFDNKQQQKFYVLGEIYKSQNINYKIILKADKSYGIYIYDFLLSSGKWNNNGSHLTFTDTSLKNVFFAMIRNENIIISSFLPFEFKGRMFFKE